ncbi:MAG: hypothetical protein P8182_00045 [Deltaproteobacteria bacterium]
MEKIIRNDWRRNGEDAFARAHILSPEAHPEGLNVDRIRFVEVGELKPDADVGHIASVLRGTAELRVASETTRRYHLQAGVHLYLPPGLEGVLNADAGTELLIASSPSSSQVRGRRLLLRDETFLAACACESQSLRWILTPQYLSRRIFLHHDPVLLSRSACPIAWFRTTMFDVDGLPKNQDGEPVFKMGYSSRTEMNVCYDVSGTAHVRMAEHPYSDASQNWGPWFTLDGDSTYHLNETAGDGPGGIGGSELRPPLQCTRNKHEIRIVDGYVTLICLFDPAPTGVERHRPGEYSDYAPLEQVLGTREYETHMKELKKYDEMVDRLSLAKALGTLNTLEKTELWELYVRGREAQAGIESELRQRLSADGSFRARVIAPWMQDPAHR